MTAFDLRDAIRGLARDRFYSFITIATLALTIGATTAVFSIVNGVLLKPLAYRDPGRLVEIREVWREAADKYPTLPANPRHFEEWRDRSTSFVAMAELDFRKTNLTGAGEPLQIDMVRVSGSLFDVIGTPLAIGRALTRDDERLERPAVAVVSHSLWAARLGSDPGVLGRTLTLGGRPYIVVGVLPAGFELPSDDVLSGVGTLTSRVDVLVPFRLNLANLQWLGMFNYPVIARLKPGVTLAQARAEMDVLQESIARTAEREAHEPTGLRGWISPLDESIVGRARLPLVLLLIAIIAVVLIACANLANLSLTRALSRTRDLAVRAALGASRRRLVWGAVAEQLLLAIAGGTLGLAVAKAGISTFATTAPVDIPRLNEVAIDGRVLVFAAAVSIVAGLVVALFPALRLARAELQTTLHAGGHGATDARGLRTRAVLLGVQVALSVMLLVAAGLLSLSFVRLLRVDPGFSTGGVVAVEISPPSSRYADIAPRAALYDRILEGVRPLPGVVSAAWTSHLPLTGETWVGMIGRPDDKRPDALKPSANYRFVGLDYFRTLSMPITRGRSLEERDRNGATVPAVISARAAATVWPGEDPLGRTFASGSDSEKPLEVVGIVADGHPTALDADAPLMVYLPYWFNNEGKSVLVAYTSGSTAAVVPELRRVIRNVDPDIAIADAMPLRQLVDKSVAGRRYQTSLFGAFGVVALLIATLGVYATTTYGVSRRRREMNIRVALGARTAQVFGLIVRQSTVPVGIGLAAGLIGALAVGTAMAALLFEVRAHDPGVIAAVVLLVGGVGLVATATAARQCLAVDPAAALRDE